MDHGNKAVELHLSGLNCAQSVLVAFAGELGLDESAATRMASTLGAGMGRQGQVCGAASGALLALGLHFGFDTPSPEAKERAYAKAGEFIDRFRALHGEVSCPGLLGVDLATPEGRGEFVAGNLSRTRCDEFIRDAADIVAAMIAE